MKNITQVSCSLNLGLIYSLDYSYSPQDGVNIVVFFVSEDGNYRVSNLLPLRKEFIRIGSATFSLYPIRQKVSLSNGRRVMEVEFVDDLFRLSHYYLALTGRGCGDNVYTLGTPVDNRPLSEKLQAALDPIAEQIKELTQFPDYAYSFNEFLTILRSKVNVVITASFDGSVKRDFVGTFRDVLEEWLNLYNLSYFFENGQLKIFDPTTLTVTLPAQPADAISYEYEEDVRSTYSKTVFNWYQQEGGEFSLNQTTNTSPIGGGNTGPLLVKTDTLYPMGYEFGLPQPYMDLNQVAAAQYGREFWFLYNLSKGSTSICGLYPISDNIQSNVVTSAAATYPPNNGRVAAFDEGKSDENYTAYYQYGQQLAGRLYMSNQKNNLALYNNYTWFDESQGQIFSFENVDDKTMSLTYLTPTSSSNLVPGTTINNSFPGFNYVGNRILYEDTSDFNLTGVFALTSENTALINTIYQSVLAAGNDSFNYTQLSSFFSGAQNTYVIYNGAPTYPQAITDLINGIPEKSNTFLPRFTSLPIKGILAQDYSSYKTATDEPQTVDVVEDTETSETSDDIQLVSNVGMIKARKEGTNVIYYNKYSTCASASTPPNYYGHEFVANQVSSDGQVDVTFEKLSTNSYRLTRDFASINAQVNNPYLQTMAQAKTFPTRRVSFSLNYFLDIPVNFLTNGLVGMSVSVGDQGVRASYSYSNEILETATRFREREAARKAADYSQRIRNSTLRKYEPTEVIS